MDIGEYSVSATLVRCRFKKLWETCGKGNTVKKAFCVFKRMLWIKFEMISNKLSLKKKEKDKEFRNVSQKPLSAGNVADSYIPPVTP